jgi:hypothetical protein
MLFSNTILGTHFLLLQEIFTPHTDQKIEVSVEPIVNVNGRKP